MTHDIIPANTTAPPPLIPVDASDNQRKHLQRFETWLVSRRMHYTDITDLTPYVASLRKRRLSDATIQTYVSAARSRIKALCHDNALLAALLANAQGTPADRKAIADVVLQKMSNAAKSLKLKAHTVETYTDAQRPRLTIAQAHDLFNAARKYNDPDTGYPSLKTLQIWALLAVMLGTGARSQEVCDLIVSDLYHTVEGVPCLLIRQGKGNKQRAIPWGNKQWWYDVFGFYALDLIEQWLHAAGINDKNSPVFRGVTSRHYTDVFEEPLTTSSIRRILIDLASVPGVVRIAPHGLRRTYARWMRYEDHKDVRHIRKLLGHKSTDTTEGYIGEPDIELIIPGHEYQSK